MIGQLQFVHFPYKWVLAFVLSGLLCLSSLTWAEVATATDNGAETAIAGKIIQGLQEAVVAVVEVVPAISFTLQVIL